MIDKENIVVRSVPLDNPIIQIYVPTTEGQMYKVTTWGNYFDSFYQRETELMPFLFFSDLENIEAKPKEGYAIRTPNALAVDKEANLMDLYQLSPALDFSQFETAVINSVIDHLYSNWE